MVNVESNNGLNNLESSETKLAEVEFDAGISPDEDFELLKKTCRYIRSDYYCFYELRLLLGHTDIS